jgi:Subtilase family
MALSLARLLSPLFLLLAATPASAQDWIVSFKSRSFDLSQYRQAILERRPSAEVDALVLGLEEKAMADQRGFALDVQKLGGRLVKSWWIANACLVQIDASRLIALKRHPRVLRVDADARVEPAAIARSMQPSILASLAPLPFIGRSTDARNHNADAAHAKGIKGQGGTIAILDAGQDEDMNGTKRPHAVYYRFGDIKDRKGGGIGGSRLLQNYKMGRMPADDVSWHGTAVGGVTAGEKWNKSKMADRGQAPAAGILSYALADTPGGLTKNSIILASWQKVAADRSRYGTLAANNSYLGSPDPTHPVQQALDSVNLNSDVLVVTPAGNLGPITQYSQANCNGLTVGATISGTRKVAAFSAIGPIFGDPKRNFPDLCANGVNLILPKRDDEQSYYVMYGSSIAAPQVAGAAILFRTAHPKATALLAKAAILATTDDISAQNSLPPRNTIQSFGMGYLRTDRLVDLAQGKGLLKESRIDTTQVSRDFSIFTLTGLSYTAVVTWNRLDLSSKVWDDLSLSLYDGNTLLAKADTPRNLYERLRFTAKKTAKLTLRVTASKKPAKALNIALAFVNRSSPFRSGANDAFGSTCQGTGMDEGVRVVTPPSLAKQFGVAVSNSLIGGSNQRYQQLIPASTLPASFTATGIAFRHDDKQVFPDAALWVDIEFKIGQSKKTPSTLSTTFAANFSGTPSIVLKKRRISLPSLRKPNFTPTHWAVRIPFDKNYVYTKQSGTNLLFEGLKTANSDPTEAAIYALDAYYDPTLKSGTTLLSGNLASSTGTLVYGYGLVTGFLGPRKRIASPVLDATGLATIGMPTTMTLTQGLESSAAGIIFGFSNKKFGTFNLPVELSGVGAKGCVALTSIEHVYVMPLDKNGQGAVDIIFPSFRSIIGATLYMQSIVLDTKANRLGMTFSNGQALKIGGQPD